MMTMVSLLACTYLILGQHHEGPNRWKTAKPTEELVAAGFRLDDTRSDGVKILFSVSLNNLELAGTWAERKRDGLHEGRIASHSGASLSPSGLPLGSDSAALQIRREILHEAITPWERLTVTLREPTKTDSQGYSIDPDERDRSADQVLVEKLLRIGLANMASFRFAAGDGMTANGKSIRRLKNEKTGQHSVDIDDWASAHGFAETHDAKTLSSLYRKGSRTVRVVLAAGQIEIDGHWRSLPEIVVRKDKRWYVPQASLNDLTGS